MKRVQAVSLGPSFRALTGVALALVVAAIFIVISGVNPFAAYGAMIQGAFGTQYSLASTGVRMTPILLTGIAVAISFRAGTFNIGAEGQLYVGAAAATFVGLTAKGLPSFLLAPLCLIVAFFGGMAWMLIPALLKTFRNVSEVVTTLMFNFIGILLVSYLIDPTVGPMAQPNAPFAQSPPISQAAELPILVPSTSLHSGILLALIVAVAAQLVISYTPFGFRLRMLGFGSTAAKFSGVRVKSLNLRIMLLSGGIAGVAGGVEILGLLHGLYVNFSPGYGYDGIVVALLASNVPLACVASAAFVGALRAGANNMQQVTGLQDSIVVVIQALVILFLIWNPFRRFSIRMLGRRFRVGRVVK